MSKILIIDDEEMIRKMLRQALENHSYEVFEAENGYKGLDVCYKESPDLIITDLIMPDMEGLETIHRIHREMPTIKIIAISGGSRIISKDFLKIAKTLGAEYCLEKPIILKELLDIISKILVK